MKVLKYSLDNEGNINACGYVYNLSFTVDEKTPFQTITESMNWRKRNDVWEWYDYTWTYPEFAVRVTIPQTVILDSEFYSALRNHVKGLVALGTAQEEVVNEDRVMYFNQLHPDHEKVLIKDINVKIERI